MSSLFGDGNIAELTAVTFCSLCCGPTETISTPFVVLSQDNWT